jgi:hypothetical protein
VLFLKKRAESEKRGDPQKKEEKVWNVELSLTSNLPNVAFSEHLGDSSFLFISPCALFVVLCSLFPRSPTGETLET